MSSHYATLNVPETATASEVRAAYRKLSLKYHPDRNLGDKDAESRFKEISAAYDVLSDERQRERYDLDHQLGRYRIHENPFRSKSEAMPVFFGEFVGTPFQFFGNFNGTLKRRRGRKHGRHIQIMSGVDIQITPTFGGIDVEFQFDLWRKRK
jgi:molecular chaperone DnaJ